MFEPKNDFEIALLAASKDPAARPAFYDALMDAQLFFITPPSDRVDVRLRVAGQDERIAFLSFDSGDGPFIAMFSSRERAAEALGARVGEFGVVALAGRDAFAVLAQAPTTVLLNPGSTGKSFMPDEIVEIARGEID